MAVPALHCQRVLAFTWLHAKLAGGPDAASAFRPPNRRHEVSCIKQAQPRTFRCLPTHSLSMERSIAWLSAALNASVKKPPDSPPSSGAAGDGSSLGVGSGSSSRSITGMGGGGIRTPFREGATAASLACDPLCEGGAAWEPLCRGDAHGGGSVAPCSSWSHRPARAEMCRAGREVLLMGKMVGLDAHGTGPCMHGAEELLNLIPRFWWWTMDTKGGLHPPGP